MTEHSPRGAAYGFGGSDRWRRPDPGDELRLALDNLDPQIRGNYALLLSPAMTDGDPTLRASDTLYGIPILIASTPDEIAFLGEKGWRLVDVVSERPARDGVRR